MRRLMVALVAVMGLSTSQAWAAGWQAVTLVNVSAGNYGGAIVTFQISGTYDNSGGCAAPTAYTIRDPASLNQELAVLMAAFVSGHTINVYVTGSCDSDNNPSVVGVTIK